MPPIKLALAATLVLGISSANTFAYSTNALETPSKLILEIDLETLDLELNNTLTTHTYHETSQQKSTDPFSTSIISAKRTLRRLTNFHYKKGQKLKAKLGKSSCTLQYTYKL